MKKDTNHKFLDIIDTIITYVTFVLGIASIIFILAPVYYSLRQILCFFGHNFNYTIIVVLSFFLWYFNFGFGKGRFAMPPKMDYSTISFRIKVSIFLIGAIIILIFIGDYIMLVDSPKC